MKNNTKTKTIVTIALSLVLCLALAIGGTMAIFSAKDEVTGITTAGTVSVTATKGGIVTSSGKMTSANTYDSEKTAVNGIFTCGGTAKWNDNGILEITNMAPWIKLQLV